MPQVAPRRGVDHTESLANPFTGNNPANCFDFWPVCAHDLKFMNVAATPPKRPAKSFGFAIFAAMIAGQGARWKCSGAMVAS
jgi:hypothetical protein